MNSATLFIQHFSTCCCIYCHHHPFKCMSASFCHHSLMKVAACCRNVGRTIVHFWLVWTKVLSCLYLATQAFSNYTCLVEKMLFLSLKALASQLLQYWVSSYITIIFQEVPWYFIYQYRPPLIVWNEEETTDNMSDIVGKLMIMASNYGRKSRMEQNPEVSCGVKNVEGPKSCMRFQNNEERGEFGHEI